MNTTSKPFFSEEKEKLGNKFAFVRILGDDRFDQNIGDYNVGLRYLADAVKRKGVGVDIYDPLDTDRLTNPQGYAVVGFYVHHINIVKSLDLAKALKKNSRQPFIVFGGHHASATAKEILEDNPFVDAVCVGEGEDIMCEIAGKVASEEDISNYRGKLSSNPYWDIENLSFPEMPEEVSIARVSTSRGCPYSCSFCTTPAIRKIRGEPLFRARSPESVVEEISRYVEAGAKQVRINDDIYIQRNSRTHGRALEIARKLLQNRVDANYKAEFRIDAFDPNQISELRLLRESGLREVFLGIESGSDKILEEYNKKLKRRDILERLHMYNDVGIVVNAGNILVSPNSSIDEICDSVEGFRSFGLAYLFFRRVTFRAHIFPGTELERRLLLEGRIEDKPRYVDRKYRLLDRRIEDIATLFEERMPEFLNNYGSFFSTRRRVLHKVYDGDSSNNKRKVLAILDLLNNKVADLLIVWFMKLDPKRITTHTADEVFEVIGDMFGEAEKGLKDV